MLTMKIAPAEPQSKSINECFICVIFNSNVYGCRKTAKTFLAASVFLELLRTFGDIDPDVCDSSIYCL